MLGKKGGAEEPQVRALGRSLGGLTTKIHMLCDASGVPLKFLLSGGQTSDIVYAQPWLYERTSLACAVAPANAVDDYLLTKAMTPKQSLE